MCLSRELPLPLTQRRHCRERKISYTDLTELREAEQKLIEATINLRLSLVGRNAGVFTLQLDGLLNGSMALADVRPRLLHDNLS